MKITALLVLKSDSSASSSSSAAGGGDSLVLANATDVSHFGYFQRGAAKEFILFVARTVSKRTPPGQRQSVQHEGYYLLSMPIHRFIYVSNKFGGKYFTGSKLLGNIRSLACVLFLMDNLLTNSIIKHSFL
jgi:hypothetical protein